MGNNQNVSMTLGMKEEKRGESMKYEEDVKPKETQKPNIQRQLTISSYSSHEDVEKHVRAECEELLNHGIINGHAGWETIFENGDRLKVWRRQAVKNPSAFEYALRGKTEHSSRKFFRTAIVNLENRKLWDESCGEAKLLDKCNQTGVETVYWVTKYPWPVAERDYVFHRALSNNKETFHSISWVGQTPSPLGLHDFQRPIHVENGLPTHRVRVADYQACMLVRPNSDGIGSTWALRVIDDPKVAVVPTRVVNWIVSKTLPNSAEKLNQACGKS